MPRFEPYKQALQAISQRTGTTLPSLIFSFAILHEVTAVVPVVTLFCACRALGTGDVVVKYLRDHHEAATTENSRGKAFAKASEYLEEGELRAARFAKRYGLWGVDPTKVEVTSNIAGDMANAAVAYGITKALLPLRIAVSMHLTPSFARRAVQPALLFIKEFGHRLHKSR